MKNFETSLSKVVIKNNRISFIFSNNTLTKPIIRTTSIKNGTLNRKSLFEIYSLIILGFIPNIKDSKELINLFKEKSRGKIFNLQLRNSKCDKYFDILNFSSVI